MQRITSKQAADLLAVTPQTVREYTKLGFLVAVTSSGERGRGQRFYYDRGEVEAMRDGGAPAAKAYRESRGPVVKPRRGRKVGAR